MRGLVLLLCVGCGSVGIEAGSASGAPAPVPVTTRVLTPSELPTVVEAAGVLVADAVVELRFEVAGRVVHVGFDDGDAVREGQVLVRLDPADATSAVTAAKARLALAEATAARAEELLALDRVSRAEADAAGAQRKLATTDLARAERALERLSVRAPRAGRVTVRGVEVGSVVDPGTVLTTLVDAEPLLAELALPEDAVGAVTVGMGARVWRPGRPDLQVGASVHYVAPAVDPSTRLLPVRVALQPTEASLAPGQTVRVAVELAAPAGQLLVPSEAVTTRASGPLVWVVEEGVVHARDVVLGARRADDVAVVHGLSAGETVVVQGLARLREGAAVRVPDGATR